MITIGPITFFFTKRPAIRFYLKFQIGNFKISNYPKWFRHDYKQFKSLVGDNVGLTIKDYPIFFDRTDSAGCTNNYYFIQDLYMAQKIFRNKPQKHVDIGSRVDGFVAHVASFMEVELFDIRNMDNHIPNIKFKQADLMDDQSTPSDYCDSISSLHALEHFGLGRYGDPIDPNGHLKAFRNITKILKAGGLFYFSVPMGIQRVEFNAHRCFSLPYLVEWVSKDYTILSFAYIDDDIHLYKNVDLSQVDTTDSFGCKFGCALFELKKR